jgi:SPP1 gp7 family putative phage head morphogenesis protein
VHSIATITNINHGDEPFPGTGPVDPDDLAHGIWTGKYTPENLPEPVYKATANKLVTGVNKGYGKTLKHIEYNSPEKGLLAHLQSNTFAFSAAKTFHQTIAMTEALRDGDRILPFGEFREKIGAIVTEWNENWLSTEYNTAIASGQTASDWARFQQEKGSLPNLRYSTIGDACPICQPMDGIIQPVDDPFWDVNYPPQHFNCRCLCENVEEEDGAITPESQMESLSENLKELKSPVFDNNVGKTGQVFNADHPFFDIPKDYHELAAANFGMPIPETVTKLIEQYPTVPKLSKLPTKVTKVPKAPKEPKPVSPVKPPEKVAAEPTTLNAPTIIGDQTRDEVRKIQEVWFDSLTSEQKQAIREYTGGGYKAINAKLRGQTDVFKKCTPYEKEQAGYLIPHLKEALKTGPRYEGRSYRGYKLPQKEWEELEKTMKPGAIFMDPAFLSSTTLRSKAEEFASSEDNEILRKRVFLTIQDKRGIAIKWVSSVRNENEVLFKTGTPFIVKESHTELVEYKWKGQTFKQKQLFITVQNP